jgi:hypothetical protein
MTKYEDALTRCILYPKARLTNIEKLCGVADAFFRLIPEKLPSRYEVTVGIKFNMSE